MKRTVFNLILNLTLLFGASIMVFSGLLIQIRYHMGHHGTTGINSHGRRIDYFAWSTIHRISVIFVSIIIFFHTIRHWKWYSTLIRKKLYSKNRQVLLLTLVFLTVAITGYIPWMIKLGGGDEMIRKTFIEIHDKLALILFVFLILHVTKRLKWYLITIKKII